MIRHPIQAQKLKSLWYVFERFKNTFNDFIISSKLDRNDERPRFYTDPYLAHVPENLDPGHKVI